MITYIYTLSDNTGIRYVGKSDNPTNRLKNHLKECTKCKTRKERWIFKLKQQNLKPILEILDVVNINSWEEIEIYWIAQLKAWGFKLLNGTNGGEGSNGFKNKKHTFATKIKCRLAAKNRINKTILLGSTNGKAKLTETQVREIRNNTKFLKKELAIIYNVSPSCITNICKNKKWKHII